MHIHIRKHTHTHTRTDMDVNTCIHIHMYTSCNKIKDQNKEDGINAVSKRSESL